MEAKELRVDPEEDHSAALITKDAEDTGAEVAEIIDESPPEAAVDHTTTQILILDSEVFREEISKTEPTGFKHVDQPDVPTAEVASLILDEILADVLTRMQARCLNTTPEPAIQDQTVGNGPDEIPLTTFSKVSLKRVESQFPYSFVPLNGCSTSCEKDKII